MSAQPLEARRAPAPARNPLRVVGHERAEAPARPKLRMVKVEETVGRPAAEHRSNVPRAAVPAAKHHVVREARPQVQRQRLERTRFDTAFNIAAVMVTIMAFLVLGIALAVVSSPEVGAMDFDSALAPFSGVVAQGI